VKYHQDVCSQHQCRSLAARPPRHCTFFARSLHFARCLVYRPLVPSLLHESLLLLFQNRPELAPEMLEILGVALPDYASARIESANFNNIIPAEYRADLVVLLVNGKPVFAIVVEVQLGVDKDKLFS
jgi:hypothetical protein